MSGLAGVTDLNETPPAIVVADSLLQDGVEQLSDLSNSRRREKLSQRFTSLVTIAGGNGTGVYNRGRLGGAMSRIRAKKGGIIFADFDFRCAQAFAELMSGRRLPAVALPADAAAGAYNLIENFPFWFSRARTVHLGETKFLEKQDEPGSEKNVKIQHAIVPFRGNNLPRMVAGLPAGATAVMTGLQCTLQEWYDSDTHIKPDYRIWVDEILKPVNQAAAALRIDLPLTRKISGLLIQCDSDVGEVADIINNLTFKSDRYTYINNAPWLDLVEQLPAEGFGDALSDTQAYYWIDFVRFGRLSTMLDPAAAPNLRLEVNCKTTAQAGATLSQIRVVPVQYEQIDGVTASVTSHAQKVQQSAADQAQKTVAK